MSLEPRRSFVRNNKGLSDFLRPLRGVVEHAKWDIIRAHSPVR